MIFASLAFWAAGARSLSRDLMDFTLLVSTYPASIYSGWTKLVAFTILPAGFVAMAPVALVRQPSWQAAGIALGGAAIYAALAAVVFHLGLARYRRGALAGQLTPRAQATENPENTDAHRRSPGMAVAFRDSCFPWPTFFRA